jgi:hypothetical protein
VDDLYVDVGYMNQGKYECIEGFPIGHSGRYLYRYLLSGKSPFNFQDVTWQEQRAYGITKDELKQFISDYYEANPISLDDRGIMFGRDIQKDLPRLIEAVDKLDENGEYCIRAFVVPG